MTNQQTAARTISSQVTVNTDPRTAFDVFTTEIDQWWVRGPVNFFDGARAIGMRCEPGVGGRLLELYAPDASDALVLGRITTWQPGELLAWDSAVDDVMVEVRFRPEGDGTNVTVTATVPAGGADHGGTAWVRVVPGWLGAWCEQRGTATAGTAAAAGPPESGRLALAIYYAKPAEAASWLAAAFGLGRFDQFGGEEADEPAWIEFRVGTCSLMLFAATGEQSGAVTHVPWVFVDDLDAHLAQARSAGATILTPVRQHGYRAYEAADCEGHRWTFAQARPGM